MAENIRYYMDEHVAKAVARGLRRRGVDVPLDGVFADPEHTERPASKR